MLNEKSDKPFNVPIGSFNLLKKFDQKTAENLLKSILCNNISYRHQLVVLIMEISEVSREAIQLLENTPLPEHQLFK